MGVCGGYKLKGKQIAPSQNKITVIRLVMFVQKSILLIASVFALSACVTTAGTNPYYAVGAGDYVVHSAPTGTGNIHVISEGELHW